MAEQEHTPEIGDIVHYFSDYYGCLPAIIMQIEPAYPDTLQLVAFRPSESEPSFWEAASYSAEPRHGTWHHKGHGAAYLPPWIQEQEGK